MTYKRTDHYTCGHNIDFHSPEVQVETCFCGRGTYDGSLVTETKDNGVRVSASQPYSLGDPIRLSNGTTISFSPDELRNIVFPPTSTTNNLTVAPTSPMPESQEPVSVLSVYPEFNYTPTSTSVDEELDDHARTCPICMAERERAEAHQRRSTYEEEQEEEEELGANNEDERRIEDVDVV